LKLATATVSSHRWQRLILCGRGKGFDTDGGWRIDYALATPALGKRCTGAVVGKAPSYAERWSDHAPLTVTFA
jgi:exodeoxyribonuclease-3